MSEKLAENEVCETFYYDEEKVNGIQPKIHDVDGAESIFKALSDGTRLKIVYALTLSEELCVCDIANIIGSSTATASHHLRFLRDMTLTKSRKKGKMVFYSLDDDHVRQLVNIAMIHSKEGTNDGK